jgi:bifunctional non-homologous end joining protein LigD
MSRTVVRVGSKTLRISNLDKVLYPATGFTKAEVIDYYNAIAPVMLPHVKDRPVAMKRFPDGVEGKSFFQKECPSGRPEWVETTEIDTERDSVNFCTIDDAAGLVWLANLASLEIHPLLARKQNLARPTHLIFDLDPRAPANLLDCLPVALALRDLLADLGLKSFPKTSGSKGLHMAVPLNTPVTFEQTKPFARAIAGLLEKRMPRQVTANMRKAQGRGKVFVDWSQNDDFKSTVSPYSLRAKDRPTVSTPVAWEEIEEAQEDKNIARVSFEAEDVRERVEALGDLHAPVAKLKQRLPETPSPS